jgi:sugar phosphate permease
VTAPALAPPARGGAFDARSYRWAVLAAGTAAQASFSAIWFGVSVLAPALRSQYGLTLAQTGVLIGASLAGSTLSLVPWGIFADRFGERAALACGLSACGGALWAAGQARSFVPLAALLAAAGLLGASVAAASGRAVLQWFPPKRRGVALGIRQTAIPLGGLAASLVLPHLPDPAWGFRVLGLACLTTAAVGGVVVREPPAAEPLPRAPVGPLRDRRIWTLSVGSAFMLGPQIGVVGFTVLFLHDRRGIGAASAAAVLAAVQVLGVVARVGAGHWSDVVRSRIRPLRRIAVAAAGLTALTALLVPAPLVLLLPVLVVAGALAMSWNGLSFAAATELAGPGRSGAAIGFQQTVLGAAAAALPPTVGAVIAAAGWEAGFGVLAFGPLTAFWILRSLAIAPP